MDASSAVKGFNDLGKAADRNLAKADARIDRFASRFQKAGAGMLAGAGLAAAGLYKAGQAAGDLEQAMGGTEAVFGEASGVIDDFAKKAAQAAGLSESAFRTATTSIGGQLKGLGFTVEEAADQAVKLTQVAADLSATYGGTTAEAVSALGAAFRGEADPAERFNLFLNQTRVNAKAVELGLAATTSQVDANAKAQATLALITEQSADAQGQFGRESDTAQGAMARFSAASENLKATIGGAVAPVLADLADGIGGLIQKFNDLPESTQRNISRFALLGTGALGAAGALSFTIGKVADMRENLSGLTGKLRNSEGGLNRFGKALTGLGVVGTVAGLATMANSMNDVNVDVDGLADSLANLTDKTEEQTKLQILAADAFGNLDSVVEQLAQGNAVAATKFIDLAEAAGISSEKIAEYRDVVDDNRQVQAQAIIDQDKNTTAINETVDALGGVPSAAKGAAGAVDGMTTSVDRQKAALDKAKGSLDLFKQGLEDAFGELDLQEVTDRRAQDFEDMAQRFADAQRAVVEAKQRVSDLLATPVEDRSASFGRDLAAAQTDVQDAINETSRALEGNSQAALTNREDLRKVTEDIGAIIEKHREEGASLQELKTIRDIEKQGLIDQLEQLGFNQTEIGEYIAAIERIPLTKVTTVTAETAAAEARIKRLISIIETVPGGIDAAQAEKFLIRETQAEREGRAIGGPVTAGRGYKVNEYLGAGQGEEWFAPANGTVHPAGSMTGGTTSQVNNITINNPSQEPASTSIRKVRSELAA